MLVTVGEHPTSTDRLLAPTSRVARTRLAQGAEALVYSAPFGHSRHTGPSRLSSADSPHTGSASHGAHHPSGNLQSSARITLRFRSIRRHAVRTRSGHLQQATFYTPVPRSSARTLMRCLSASRSPVSTHLSLVLQIALVAACGGVSGHLTACRTTVLRGRYLRRQAL